MQQAPTFHFVDHVLPVFLLAYLKLAVNVAALSFDGARFPARSVRSIIAYRSAGMGNGIFSIIHVAKTFIPLEYAGALSTV